MALVGPRARCRRLREGEEVRIDYGERSEEESLFQYGMLTLVSVPWLHGGLTATAQ